MLLSDLIAQMSFNERFEICNEKDFRHLSLTTSELKDASCVFLDNERFIDTISQNTTMVLTTYDLANKLNDKSFGVCATQQPRLLFFLLHNFLSDKPYYSREVFDTKIGQGCSISEMSSIAGKNIIIGNNVTIEEFVVIRENTTIGDNTILRAGVKIGGVGFEFKYQPNSILSVAHCGGVVIGKNVEVQNNSCIDRALYPWDDTVIGDYTKLDSLVQISHAVKIEGRVMIAGSSIIGGRVTIGSGTWIGFGVSVRNGIAIGKNARANMGAIVTKSIPNNKSVSGNFAIDHEKFIKNIKNQSR